MHSHIQELAARQYGVFSRRQAIDAGFDEWAIVRLLRSGRWEAVLPGVYRIAGTPDTWEQRLMAACLWGEPWGAASHRSAARLWQLDGFERFGEIEITVPYGNYDHAPDVTAHRTRRPEPKDLTERLSIPATRIERTLVDLAAVVDQEALEIAMESAFRTGLTSMTRLWRRVDELSGRRGLRQLRHLLFIRQEVPAASRWEAKLLILIREAGLPEPARQFPVWDGEMTRKLDLAYPELLVGLEYDSFTHHSGRRDWERTHTRFARLTAMGWRILPITMDDIVVRPGNTIALIARVLEHV